MAEIGKLLTGVSASSGEDISGRIRADSQLRLGFQSLHALLRHAADPVEGHVWDQTQIQALAYASLAVLHAARSGSLDQVEPLIVSLLQDSMEFALCYLETSIPNTTHDFTLQNYMMQLLEAAMVEGNNKDFEASQPCPLDVLSDLLAVAQKKFSSEGKEGAMCMLQGGVCSKEEKVVECLLMTLASEAMQYDNMIPQFEGESFHCGFKKLVLLSEHLAVVHLMCIRRLINVCVKVLDIPDLLDEKAAYTSLRKRLSFCVRAIKLMRNSARGMPYIDFDLELLQVVASFTDKLPNLFKIAFDFANTGAPVESSFETLLLTLLEEFLDLLQAIFCNSVVFRNIQACITASLLETLDSEVWRYSKSILNPKPPLAYFPRVVIYIIKLIMNVKNQTWQVHELNNLHPEGSECNLSSGKVVLLKCYTTEELLEIIFPSSGKWTDNLIHLVFFLHSEGVKLRPKLERSFSSGTKASCTSEAENVGCHDEEALFGDLFSEGGRSVESVEGYDRTAITATYTSSYSNMPVQAAIELLTFLKDNIFAPEWHFPTYESGCSKLSDDHIRILLSILNCKSCYYETNPRDIVNEERKLGNIHELCFDLLHNLLTRRALSVSLEDALLTKILMFEDGFFSYNNQTLALLAHALVCRPGPAGSQFRTWVYMNFVNFIRQKTEEVCGGPAEIKLFLEALPSLFHIEVLLMAFHMSSESEKAVLAKMILSSLTTISTPSSESTELSCWALLVSRLVLVLRHMIFYPHACPSSLLLEFRSKLKEAKVNRYSTSNANKLSFWSSFVLEKFMGSWMRDSLANNRLLDELVDITPTPACLGTDTQVVESLGMSWKDICASFSSIMEFWKGKKAGVVEDLIIERYMFVLCWDVPIMKSSSEHLLLFSSGLQIPEISNLEHFVYFSHLVISHSHLLSGTSNFPGFILTLLEHLDALPLSEDSGELGWGFLKSGSWLALVLSLLNACISISCTNTSINSSSLGSNGGFSSMLKDLMSSFSGNDHAVSLSKTLSSLLNKYLQVYQRAFVMISDNSQQLDSKTSPLLLIKHTDFNKDMKDELTSEMGLNLFSLESLYEVLSHSDTILQKMAQDIPSKIFWEMVLHGFPCSPRVPSAILLSCILNIRGLILVLDGLLQFESTRKPLCADAEVSNQILESVLYVKTDRVFASVHGKCEDVYLSLSEGCEQIDLSSLLLVKQLEEFLSSISMNRVANHSLYECLVTKFIDLLNGLRQDAGKMVVFRFYLSMEDISGKMRDIYGSYRGDLSVLIDSLGNCDSESVNIKVLDFFVELLTGDVVFAVRQKIQLKFISMDSFSLSKWLENRILGCKSDASGTVGCVKESSATLRESTMNFVLCLLSSPTESLARELRKHVFDAMLVSIDNAFMLFDADIAKSYFSFLVQLSRGESLIVPLVQRTMVLMEKLSVDEHSLHGLKYIFGFLAMVLDECGSNKHLTEKLPARSLSGSQSTAGSVSAGSMGSRINPDPSILPANQRMATSLDCDATSVDDDEDDGTSDGEMVPMYKDDEEDANSERALASKVCTFTSSGSNFMEQHWYFCYTCDLTVSKGCCSVCAKVCHRGHRVVYSRSSRFFCDCGAGGVRGSNCRCLKPRKYNENSNAPSRGAGNFQSFIPFAENGDQLPDTDSDVDEDPSIDLDNSVKLSITKEVQDEIATLFRELDMEVRVLNLCSLLLPSIVEKRDSYFSRDRSIVLREDKLLCYTGDLFQLKKAYKSGSLDLKIKTDYSNAKELKSHLASGSLVKSLLSVSTRGRLAVGEGDKVAIFDVGQLIGQATIAPVTADKANVKPVSKNVVRFEIVHLIFNPVVENYLCVAGYEDCQVLTVNHRGEVTDRLAIELALQGAYIRLVDWVPGSQVQLMVVTNRFVKIYDLSQDNISPMHYFTLRDDMILDATLVVASQGRLFIVVLSEQGTLYRAELSMKGNVGAKTLKDIIHIESIDVNTRGSSLYFSTSHKLLFLSYQDGTTLVGRLNSDATSLVEQSAIFENEPEGKQRPAALHRWKELVCGSGLFVCSSSVKSNTSFAISMGEHEIRVQNMRHAIGSASPLVGITAYKPLSKDKLHCLVLHDDGSLQIYSHVPSGVDIGATAVSDKIKKLVPGILANKVFGGAKPEFPLDFFEKTICITPDVKLSGDAIRNGDSEAAKQTLASEDGFLESPNSSGFKVTVSNSNPDIVMVGFRLHVGNTSASHIPSEITIFQRVIKLDEGMRSWYDIPFTVAESLLADEEFFITVGPTFSGSGLPRIDCLEVYGRAKDDFGWKEKMDALLHMESHVLGNKNLVAGADSKSCPAHSASVQEEVVADGLKLLSRIYSFYFKAEEAKVELSKLKCRQLLEVIFESDREALLLKAACCVLQAVYPKKEIYHQVKDTLRLTGVVKSSSNLSFKLGTGTTTAGWIIEEFTEQMRAVSKIALHHRLNLASFLETNGSDVVDGLMQVLWGILELEQPDTQTMNNIVVASVELIYCYAECLAAGKHSVGPAVSLFKKLLFSTNEAVQTSSSLAISSRLLQVPFPKQTMLGADDAVENATSVSSRTEVSGVAGNSQVMVDEDSITSSVQYCCDGCSTVPILRRRWHCTICPDFDLCEACYEVLDADRLPPPHSRDHPMTAIPIEMETMGGEGSEIHFAPNELTDSGLVPVTDVSMQNMTKSLHELEQNESNEFVASVVDPVTISASKRAVNSALLSELLEQLRGWMETTSGVQAVPILQLFHRLSSAIGGPFVDSFDPDSINMEKLVKWFVDEINLNRPFAAKNRSSFGEVIILVFMFFTLMLRNWNQPSTDGSASKSTGNTDAFEKSTFHAVSSSSVSFASGMDVYEKNDFISHLSRACSFIRQQSFVNYLMDILQQLVHVFKAPSVAGDTFYSSNPATGCGALLTVRRELPAGNFSPFFTDSYAKSHRTDMFGDYHRLLLENTFRLVYSLIRPEKHEKAGEKEKSQKISSGKDLKLDGYQDILCSYINNPHTSFVRRYARRLFLHLCGSKTHYYSVRDSWQFSNEVNKLYKHVNKSGGLQSVVSYERSVKIVKCLTTMAEVALARPRNWQKYCLRHGDILPFLLNGALYFGEECVIQTLKLLSLAFYFGKDVGHSSQKSDGGDTGASTYKSGIQSSDSNSKKKKKSEDGGEPSSEKSYLDMEPVLDVFLDRSGELLRQFIDMFLLEWNSSSVRTEAKCMLHGLWSHGKQSFKENLLTVLLQKVQSLPMYGQNIVEYTELVTSLLGKLPDNNAKQLGTEIIDKCLTSDVIRCIFETLHSQNELLANHPNSRIYNTLSGLVEFDGYYLESEPCVACSSPEVPYSRMKLETLKSETKFTDNRIIVKCTGSYTIQSVTMNVHDARKSKSVKVLNLYYNNRPVADLSELKNNWSLWKRAKSCCIAFNQTDLKVEFPIPITACNFMIELDSFYENLQALSLEPLQCPRCSRPVTDKHGICSNCHENAYQCRQCRNINYENLDSFLCNECGYSKYGRFEFNFMAKPSFTFDSMENDEDMKRGLAAIESESENAHRRYQQLLGFKKPLLKIVSSIGENDMDSQQKDSVQQMMVSLPGPSCKINRKVALLGVLYGEKCKAAFDSVSKSVQTLQGLRRVLMSYLHKKQTDGTLGASRFVMERCPKSCYGCASTFVTQCLEVLQVLSKHPSSKKQLVSAGILSELFENNIHQGPKTARVQARAALCAFSEGDMNAVVELNNLIQKKVMYCLEHHRSMDIALATREELLLLSDVCSLTDEFWESRLRVVFQLLFSSIKLGSKHPAISEHVILPCLRIVSQACTPPKPDTAEKELVSGKGNSVPQQKEETNSLIIVSKEKSWDGMHKSQDIQLLSYSEWEKGASYLDFVRRQYKVTQAVKGLQKSRSQKYDYLTLKYALRWKRRASKAGRSEMPSFELGSWVTELILSACSQSIRSEMCMLIGLLCGQSSSRRYRLLNLLMSLLPATLSAGENAAEYFELLFRMIESEDARLFLTVRGYLSTICKLIGQEVGSVESLERSLHINISQGFILHKLIELLGKFLDVPNIRSRFMREQLLSEVLEALIVIRGLIVQKTKLISDCNKLLKDLLDSLLLESNENKSQFIQACICGLQVHRDEKKGRASLFILEQLCNLISPSKPEPVYLLILNKAHTQEEFIRGSMTKNPYSSSEVGPLMRDVKNKICHQLDLLGLVEDDYGMELLVAGNIISLDLSISQVYEQVWKKSPQFSASAAGSALLSSSSGSSARDCPPMTVTYRLQGLDGEATEPMIKELDEDREESQDPEVEFAIAGAVRECGGLEILLGFLQRLRDDLKSNQEQLLAVLRLLMLCCKIRENRRALLKLGALGLLLETARRAFSVDAMEPAEGILLIVESLTLETNESDSIIIPGILTVSSEEAGAGEQAKKIVLMFLERLSQPSGLKKSNKQQRNTEMVARILPYLTYGEPAAMEALIQHFDPYLRDWGEFDRLQLLHEDNVKDEKIAEIAIKQKFALENFVRVSESLKSSSCGERLKDIILEKEITSVAIKYLKDTFPFTGQAGYKASAEWTSGLKVPSVPLILSMLRGLSMGHLATQKCVDEEGVLPLLHALEGVSGENEIGARAENLLDTLSDKEGNGDGFLGDKVRQLRHATRDEMRRRALRKREELLQGLGMRQELSSDGGERIVVARPNLEGFDDVEEEEDGLACMVCREGYRLRPMDLLGVYTYSKRVNLGSGNTRGDCVYTTVSHFNIIHFQCHQEAKRADAALKNPKKEWDGAALRNNETLCNNLFPLRCPSVPLAQYIRNVDQYWDYLNAIGRADGSRLRLLTYDIVLMLARFATGASFSADSRGGGKESNARFLPFMIQMARHLLDHDVSQRLVMAKSITTYLSSPSMESKPANIPGGQPSVASEETVQFMMVSSLLSESYDSWVQHRRAFLQRGIYHAYMQQAHGRSTHRSSTTTIVRPDLGSTSRNLPGSTGESEELLSVVQPMLVYTGMIEQLQHFFKVKRSNAATVQAHKTLKEVEGENESEGLEDWEVVMKEKLLNVKEMVGFSKELLSWLDDMTSASDLQEAFDIIGVLGDVLSPGITTCEDFVRAAINAGKS